MGHGKEKSNRIKKKKVWKILDGTYKKPIGKEDVERLVNSSPTVVSKAMATLTRSSEFMLRDPDSTFDIQA